ncbi:MAG: HEAT repeat domain-containing protein [Planctomycetota bacterium]
MLPSTDLQPAYDKIVWLYVYRDFSEDERDRRAERISLRFGVTSWPQLFLVDPHTLEIRRHTGRTVESFLRAVAAVEVEAAEDLVALERTRAAEARAEALEGDADPAAAASALDDEDIVVRTRALQVLAREDPAVIVARARSLLQVPSDPFRYAICEVLKEAADPTAARALEALVADPRDSLNPNVLRIRAVQALATCGDADSVPFIAPHASSGVYFNGLTGQAVDALAAIARRHPESRDAVRTVLKAGYPVPPEEGEERALRACVGLAKRIFEALGEEGAFPDPYDDAAREALMK